MEKRNNHPKQAGIYKFTCVNNGKVYIGKSVCIRDRLHQHKKKSKNLTGSYLFEKALIKHGWESFKIDIIEVFEDFDKNDEQDRLKIIEREAFYIEKYDSTNNKFGYNNCKFGTDRTGCIGPKLSEETRKKMSISQKGRKIPLAVRKKISLGNKGKPKSKEHVEKNRQANLGKKLSEETKQKIGNASRGRKHSEESKEKLRNINLGRKMSEEARKNMSESQKGHRNNLGKIRSDESKEKSRQSRLAYLNKVKFEKQINEKIE